MILHTYWRSSSAYRVRIALGLKGVSYESRFVHLVRSGGEQNQPEFRAKSPLGQVPVLELEDGGAPIFLSQSLAIIEYLEERFPAPALLPRELLARARVRELAELVNSGIQPFQNTGTMNFLTEVAAELDKARWYRHFLGRGLSSLEARARESAGRFLVADDVSVADVLLVPQLYAARRVQISLEAFPTLLRVEAECEKIEGFAVAHPDRQPDRQ
ncbi:MAG TPA: maleylacetoacetate isomerase [Polyangiaceae bacterium]|jgi:maleylpyruvate isomerase|nr:maleylacetoacetate isomerase [Polyangiaceae bacterium]